MDALLAMVEAVDPDLVFVNLGDIDRVGHSDLSGRRCGRRHRGPGDTDLQVGRFVDHLKGPGSGRTACCVLADHSMDWSCRRT